LFTSYPTVRGRIPFGGFYAGISGANMKNGTNIILWTEASDASQAYVFEKIK